MKKIALLMISAVFLLTGCASSPDPSIPLDRNDLDITVKSGKGFTLGVQDRRPYVLDGTKPSNFAGIMRFMASGDLFTGTGRPLADEFSSSIQKSLMAKGISVKVVSLPSDMAEGKVISLLRTPSEKSVLILIREWQSLKVKRLKLTYDLEVRVYDETGKLLAKKQLAGDEVLGGGLWDSMYYSTETVPPAFKRKMEELFSDPELIKSL